MQHIASSNAPVIFHRFRRIESQDESERRRAPAAQVDPRRAPIPSQQSGREHGQSVTNEGAPGEPTEDTSRGSRTVHPVPSKRSRRVQAVQRVPASAQRWEEVPRDGRAGFTRQYSHGEAGGEFVADVRAVAVRLRRHQGERVREF